MGRIEALEEMRQETNLAPIAWALAFAGASRLGIQRRKRLDFGADSKEFEKGGELGAFFFRSRGESMKDW